jgi:hypothetical protein
VWRINISKVSNNKRSYIELETVTKRESLYRNKISVTKGFDNSVPFLKNGFSTKVIDFSSHNKQPLRFL